MSENVPVLVPKRGRPTEWEVENCFLFSCDDGPVPVSPYGYKFIYEPGGTACDDWSEVEWYVAFQIADPPKLKLVQYRAIHKESITIWLPEGQQFLISGYWEKTGQVREVEA